MQTINIQYTVTREHLKDLLVCAYEGGSNYWYEQLDALKRTPAGDRNMAEHFYDDIINFGMCIVDSETGLTHTISGNAKYKKAFEIFAQKYESHFADLISGNTDANTGDVFLQCLVFGEVIYG